MHTKHQFSNSRAPRATGEAQTVHLQKLSPRDIELTRQQQKLLRRFANGQSDKEIASEFKCPIRIVTAQRQLIIEKLKIGSQAELTAAARRYASWPKVKPE